MLKLVASKKPSLDRRDAGRRLKKSRKRRAPNAITIAQREFAAELGLDYDALSDKERGDVFERFAAFHILRRFHEQELEPLQLGRLLLPADEQAPLDCVAVMVDGRLVDSPEEVDELLEEARESVSIALVMVRASRSNRFDPERIGAFVDAACGFLRGDSVAGDGEEGGLGGGLGDRRALLGHVITQAEALDLSARIGVWAYLAALGAWDGDAAKEIELRRARDTIGATPWITDVEVEAVDKSRILDMMATSLPLRAGDVDDPAEIDIEDYEARLPAGGLIPLPRIGAVGAGYCGHVPVGAFLSLLEREDGQGLREAIFTQNVRGYQGDRGVNERIRGTLAGPDRAEFLLRNNGVTVVADTLDRDGRDVRLTNYQIVNGLQTSTVIYKMRDQLRDAGDVHVPVKLVATTNNTVRRAIIDATNRQTPITGAALFAACEKALSIESYFFERMRSGGPTLFLERRPGQYPKSFEGRRVSLEDLLRAYYAVFLEAPQIAEKGFAAIAGDVDDGLLAPSLTAEPYYVAARILCLVREVAQERDEPRLAQLEHHGALAVRVMCAPGRPPVGDAGAMRAMCRRIELQLGSDENRGRLADALLSSTQSPRDRMKNRIQGVPTLKRTRDDVLKRARGMVLPDPR